MTIDELVSEFRVQKIRLEVHSLVDQFGGVR